MKTRLPNIFLPGLIVQINPFRDIGIDPDIRPYIGKEVRVIKLTKKGMVFVKTLKKPYKELSIPQSNIDLPVPFIDAKFVIGH